jgi:hypothetical protein
MALYSLELLSLIGFDDSEIAALASANSETRDSINLRAFPGS